MTLIARAKPAGWSTNERLTSAQQNLLDTNVATAGDYLERLSAIPFFNPRYADFGGSVGIDAPPLWVERNGSTGRGFWCVPYGAAVYISDNNGGSAYASGAAFSGTLIEGADNGTTGVFSGTVNSYYFTDPTTFTSLASLTGRGIIWDGTNFILSRGTSGIATSATGTSFSAAATPPPNWTSSNHFAVQFATNGSRVVGVTNSTSQYIPYSDDNGDTWTDVSVNSLAWAGVAYRPSSAPSGALWMAVSTTGHVYTSSTGAAWSLATTLASTEYPAQKLHVLNDWFVTVTSNEDIIFSKDGVTWYCGDRVSFDGNTNGKLGLGRHNLAGISVGSTDYLWTTQSAPLLALVGV